MKFLYDFFPILLFFIAYKLGDIYIATGVAMAASVVQVGAYWIKHRKFENMHLITLGLIMFLGGATLIFHDKSFFMWKPTIVNWLFAAAFLGSQFIGNKPLVERMMSHAIDAPDTVWKRLNFSWVLFFILMGVANIYVANIYFQAETLLNSAAGQVVELETCAQMYSNHILDLCNSAKQSEENWVNFKLFGMLGLTLLFVVGQAVYLSRHIREEEATVSEVVEQQGEG